MDDKNNDIIMIEPLLQSSFISSIPASPTTKQTNTGYGSIDESDVISNE